MCIGEKTEQKMPWKLASSQIGGKIPWSSKFATREFIYWGKSICIKRQKLSIEASLSNIVQIVFHPQLLSYPIPSHWRAASDVDWILTPVESLFIYIYKLVEKKIRNGKFGKDNDLHFFTRSGRILKMGLEFDGPVDDQLTAGGLGGRGPGPWSPWPPSPFPDGSACGRRSEGGRRKKSASASTTQHMTKNMPSGWLFPPTGPWSPGPSVRHSLSVQYDCDDLNYAPFKRAMVSLSVDFHGKHVFFFFFSPFLWLWFMLNVIPCKGKLSISYFFVMGFHVYQIQMITKELTLQSMGWIFFTKARCKTNFTT